MEGQDPRRKDENFRRQSGRQYSDWSYACVSAQTLISHFNALETTLLTIFIFNSGGDAIDGLLSLVLINSSRKVSGGLDAGTRNKMLMNVVLEVIIGFTPVLGNFADIFFRCNTKNAALLEEMLKKRVDKAILQADKTGQYGGRLEDRRDHTVPPARPMRPLHGINPHGDQGRYAIEQPVKQESGGWKSGLGLQDGSAKEKSWRSYGALAQSQTNGVVGQQGRKVIGAHDL